MSPDRRIAHCLHALVERRTREPCPPQLAEAIAYAVFPGGHRIRPRICLAVAAACGADNGEVAQAAATSIELLHCASLVHDDMPCFDDAEIRRGKPSVHRAYGEQIALLCGDALIVLAFQALAEGAHSMPDRMCSLTRIVGRCVGLPGGIVAGQAWECESRAALEEYQRAKTGALFAASTMAGAAAAGLDFDDWAELGERLGLAYQVTDDLLDRYGDPDMIGKPVGRDAELGRPNAVAELGLAGATRRIRDLIEQAVDAVPDCPGRSPLRERIRAEAQQFMQEALDRRAAA